MIDILDKNVSFNVSEDILSFGNKRNSVIKDLLYKFLIKFYIFAKLKWNQYLVLNENAYFYIPKSI